MRWHYLCPACGRRAVTNRSDMTHCPIPVGPIQVEYPPDHPLCGAEYGDVEPFAYLSDLLEAIGAEKHER